MLKLTNLGQTAAQPGEGSLIINPTATDDTRRKWALVVLCVGVFMIVVDGTAAGIALPSIRMDLRFSDATLLWVVNAYTIPYAGFLLVSGRLGDVFGHRNLFLGGIAIFTIASLICAGAGTPAALIVGRIAQGMAAATVAAAAQSLLMRTYVETGERAKAIGVYGFACSGGGIAGLLLAGVLTSVLGWRWIFLINIPIGAAVCLFGRLLFVTTPRASGDSRSLDLAGAALGTAALSLGAYAITDAEVSGWTSTATLGRVTGAIVLGILFVRMEARARYPLVPVKVFRNRSLALCSVIRALSSTAQSATVFASLYLQLVLGYSAWKAGLAFVPLNLVVALSALGLSAKLVVRLGMRTPLILGLLLAAGGSLYLARAPLHGAVLTDVLPAMVLFGLGVGISFTPVLMAAMSGVPPEESGLVSGVVNTASNTGGAIGLAALAGVAAARTSELISSGATSPAALGGGYHLAFVIAAACSAMGAVVASLLPGNAEQPDARPTLPEASRDPGTSTS